MEKQKNKLWYWFLIKGILMLIISFLIMFNPVFAGVALIIWVGVILAISGIYNVIGSFALR